MAVLKTKHLKSESVKGMSLKIKPLKAAHAAGEYFRAFYRGNRLLYAAVTVLDTCYNFLLILISVTLGDLMDLAVDGTMPMFFKSCAMVALFLSLN
ncbi:MAG: hypothetical protein LUE87_03255, partial [Lachnospiraceae bacterium]|nr:hypothetical protein [Lachnospiraceae bacterium]